MAPRKTKRGDGRYSSTLRYVDPVTGAKKRAYFYGKTQAESKAKAEKARQRLAHGAPVRDASRTLADWLGEWQVTFLEASNRALSTKVMHAGYCKTWIVPVLGHVRLDRLTVADVNRLMLAMNDAGKADATRRNAYTTLRKRRVARPRSEHLMPRSASVLSPGPHAGVAGSWSSGGHVSGSGSAASRS